MAVAVRADVHVAIVGPFALSAALDALGAVVRPRLDVVDENGVPVGSASVPAAGVGIGGGAAVTLW